MSPLIDGGFRNAARSEVGTHLVPDWHAVAGDFDGVHLSWAGFLTTEGFISDLSDDAVTMLRYWSGERTLWLADAFLEPLPLAAPTLSGGYCNVTGADVRTDSSRRQSDLADLTVSLGRA